MHGRLGLALVIVTLVAQAASLRFAMAGPRMMAGGFGAPKAIKKKEPFGKKDFERQMKSYISLCATYPVLDRCSPDSIVCSYQHACAHRIAPVQARRWLPTAQCC